MLRGNGYGVLSLLCAALLSSAVYGDAGSADIDRVRRAILQSRQVGAHGLGYGERSLNDLYRSLKPKDIPVLIALLDHKNRDIAIGASFGLAAQCGAAIDPIYGLAQAPGAELRRYGEARETLERVSRFARCPDAERKRAAETAAKLESMEQAALARRSAEIERRNAEDKRLQGEGMKMLDPAQRSQVSLDDCLAVVERNRKATGIKPGANKDSDALFERAQSNCRNPQSRAR